MIIGVSKSDTGWDKYIAWLESPFSRNITERFSNETKSE
jgi:hypothetical protein